MKPSNWDLLRPIQVAEEAVATTHLGPTWVSASSFSPGVVHLEPPPWSLGPFAFDQTERFGCRGKEAVLSSSLESTPSVPFYMWISNTDGGVIVLGNCSGCEILGKWLSGVRRKHFLPKASEAGLKVLMPFAGRNTLLFAMTKGRNRLI